MKIRTAFVPFCALALSAVFASGQDAPPENPSFEEKSWEELSNHDVHDYGRKALDIAPDKWRHAETENYILHFRRVTEARKVVRELEFNLWFVARTLGAGPDQYTRKGHAYVFEDDREWQLFLRTANLPEWSASLAVGDELFLNVRAMGGSRRFDSYLLAHEATHAVVARLYPGRRWPLWLNEGFAENMASAGVAARKNQTLGRHQRQLRFNQLGPEELEALSDYPQEELARAQLYQSGEYIVRFFLNEFPKEKFPEFVETLLDGKRIADAAVEVYELEDEDDFKRRYARFTR